MLKRKIDKAAFDALKADVQTEYKLVGSNYLLDTDDATEALSARDHEKTRADGLATELANIKTTLATTEGKLTEALKGNGTPDVAALENSYKDKLKSQKIDADKVIASLTGHLEKTLVDSVADGLAKELSTAPTLLAPFIKSRLKAEITGDTAITRILDKDGKPSASTIEELRNEVVANPEFKGIIIASKAQGGRAPFAPATPPSGGRATPSNPHNGEAPNLANMKPNELVAEMQARKAAAAQS